MFRLLTIFFSLSLISCNTVSADSRPFAVNKIAQFEEPWAMTFLPDGRLLVTEKGRTALRSNAEWREIIACNGRAQRLITGRQGGLGDVVLHPGICD